MKSTRLRLRGLFLLLIILLLIFLNHPVVQAQDKVRTWHLAKQEPSTTVASTAPTASAALNGPAVEVN